MSYDINFWKQSTEADLTAEQIYHRLCNEETVEGLELLPLQDIWEKLVVAFPDFDPTDDFPLIECETCGIEVSSSPQHVRFDLRGDEISEVYAQLAHIMATFDCPMYDPQVNKRYDKRRGTQVGRLPKITKARTAKNQRAQRKNQQAAQDILDRISAERASQSIDELSAEDAEFIECEKKHWLEGAKYSIPRSTDNIMTIFPRPIGLLGRAQLETFARIMPDSPWESVEINDIRVSRPIDGTTLVLYHANATPRDGGEPLLALVASLYIRVEDEWRLAFQQVSPDMPSDLS